ncbi:MAG: helix-turn-helix domain-containing protein [Carbonactinosporaceae bacterium]
MREPILGSTVPRRQLGRYLRDLRQASRLTVRAASQKLEWSEPKLWRIETGQTSMRSLDVETMCRIYDAPPDLTEALMGLARETKNRGWWHAYGDVVPEWFDVYIGLEGAASRLSLYESELIPGLLQTEDYARTVIRADHPDEGDEVIEQRVRLRITRQVLLTRSTYPPLVEVALNEAVLRRPVGGPNIMASQLRRLAEVGELDNVSLKVVAFGAGLHRGLMTGPFVILRFPLGRDLRDKEPPTVYVEGGTGALYLERPRDVEYYDAVLASIWGASLDEAASRDLIMHVAKEYEE